jgi:glycosyltransferase involved in cell wall biosynthesis
MYIEAIERRNVNNASAIHVASSYEKVQIKTFKFTKPIIIIPRGINAEEYKSKYTKDKHEEYYPGLKGNKVILYFGRIHFKKGFDILAEAMKKVIKERNDVRLLIAGPGEKKYVDKVTRLFNKLGIMKYAVFTGMLLGKRKLSAFYNSDIFVLPSYGENFGITVLEAMECELPVVITNHVGLCSDIREINAGIITNCDPQEIADAILKLLNSESLRRSMGVNGRKLVESKFTWDIIAPKMVNVYENIRKHRI